MLVGCRATPRCSQVGSPLVLPGGEPRAQPPCGWDQPLLNKSSRPQRDRGRKEEEPQALIYFFKALSLWLGVATAPQGSLWFGEGCATLPSPTVGATVPHCRTGVLKHQLFHRGTGTHAACWWPSMWPVRRQLHCGMEGGAPRAPHPHSLPLPQEGKQGLEPCAGKVSRQFSLLINGHAWEREKRSGGAARQWQPEGATGAHCQGKQGSHLM